MLNAIWHRSGLLHNAMQAKMRKCAYFLPEKKRQCKMDAAPGKTYCGAHSIQLEPSLAREPRIDCPYGNHSVPESLFAKHLKTCPDKRHKDEIAAQPYNIPGINAGPGPDNFLPLAPPELATGKGDTEALSNRRLALAVRRGEAALMDLLQKIDQALATLAPNIEPLSVSIPPETEHYLFSEETTANRPYSRKHAQQQASIAGNMKRKGLMFPPDSGVTYVELGAGTGYLSLCLTECFGINKVALVDMNGFRLKADRAMRHLQLQRAKCNLADFDPQGLVGMGQGEPWVGYGKHLCGAATDFALRCCVRDIAQARTENSNGPLLIPGPTEAAESSDQASTKKGPRFGLKGLAIATCCHHRCEWRHFVGQEVMIELGFSPEEFELMSWMTGKFVFIFTFHLLNTYCIHLLAIALGCL